MLRYINGPKNKSWGRRSIGGFHGHRTQRILSSSNSVEEQLAQNKRYNARYSCDNWLSMSSRNSALMLSWLDQSIQSESREHTFHNSHENRLSPGLGNHNRRPHTANPCTKINTITYNQMVSARIGVRSNGLNTYHSFEVPKTSNLDERAYSNLGKNTLYTCSAESSPRRQSRGSLLMELSLKGKPPQRCFSAPDADEEPNSTLAQEEKLEQELDILERYLSSLPISKPFKQRFFFFLMFGPDNFWNNYRHLEMEVLLFQDDNDFIRKTVLRTCVAITDKADVSHKLCTITKYCSAEYRYLMEMLKHIESAVEDIGRHHHASHLLQMQRNIREFEVEFNLLVIERERAEELSRVCDEGLFQLKLCMEVVNVHKKQSCSILREFDWFLLRYKQNKSLVLQYFQPLYEHFLNLKDDFAGDLCGCSVISHFQDVILRAIQDNCRGHNMLNQDLELKRMMPQMLSEIQFKIEEKQRYGLNYVVVDGAPEVKLGSACSGSKMREMRRSRSPEKRQLTSEEVL